MLGRLFGGAAKTEPVPEYEIVTARMNARLMPIDRGDRYEDPLDEMLKADQVGEVTGGGTQLGEESEVAFCDVEIGVLSATDKTLGQIIACLEALGATKGSKLIVEDDGREIPFGANEGLALYLNGVDLPDEVYANSDFDTVLEECTKLLGDKGRYQGHWQGPRETALYFHGPSFAAMADAIRQFTETYPLCQKSRTVQTA